MQLFSHLRQKQFEAANLAIARQSSFFDRYLEWLVARTDCGHRERSVTILARSSLSPAVRAFVDRAEQLHAHGVTAKALVARLDPESALQELAEALSSIAPDRPISDLIRWTRNNCLLDAHEQLTLGSGMCWSGDMMRRDPSKRDGIDLFETDAPQTVRLGTLAFQAIWSISETIPARHLHGDQKRPPNAAYLQDLSDTLPKPAFLHHAQRFTITRH